MPTSRNGKDRSQTTGRRISASSATGQQSTNRMHQPTKRIRTFILLSFHFSAKRQLPTRTLRCVDENGRAKSGQAAIHGVDRTEASNPKGIASSSPGLRGPSYPGKKKDQSMIPTPTGLCHPPRLANSRNPVGVDRRSPRCPRVARSSQPWALLRNPVGILGTMKHISVVGLSGLCSPPATC